jgi:hypothetical protein
MAFFLKFDFHEFELFAESEENGDAIHAYEAQIYGNEREKSLSPKKLKQKDVTKTTDEI